MKKIAVIVACLIFCLPGVYAQTVSLDELNLSTMRAGWGEPQAKLSVDGNPLTVAGKNFARGVGTHAVSTFLLTLDGKGENFQASVGVDDEVGTGPASVEFFVVGDKKVLWQSGVMKKNDTAKFFNVDIRNVKLLGLLVTDAGDGIDYDHADWCDAQLKLAEPLTPAQLTPSLNVTPYLLTPPSPDVPQIHGAKIFGVRPGNPFVFKVAATGKRPLTFAAQNLPKGLSLDENTGIITGTLAIEGDFTVTLHARNDIGTSTRDFRIVAGPKICLTPPMGWNSWNCWAEAVDDAKVRAAADAMVNSGLIDHGWTYINIDDC